MSGTSDLPVTALVVPDRAALDRLATHAGRLPILSVYLRTDPRDPANTRASSAWRAALAGGLHEATEQLEAGDDRDSRLAFRALRERLSEEAAALEPAALGRSLAWFVSLDGAFDERFAFQLPLRDHLVRLDERPFVSPLVDLVDRGAPTGVVLVGSERVRVLEWAHGWIEETEDHTLDIDQDDWRPHRGSTAPNPARGRGTVTHTEAVAAREDAHLARFLASAADAVAARIARAGWERVVLLGGGGLAPRFHLLLPEPARARAALDLDLNLLSRPPHEIARRIEPHLQALHDHRALHLAELLGDGGPETAVGPAAVLRALAERRVEQLVLDPLHVPRQSALPAAADELLAGADLSYAGERAVEAAVAGGVRVTVLPVADSPPLERADGMLAGLRW